VSVAERLNEAADRLGRVEIAAPDPVALLRRKRQRRVSICGLGAVLLVVFGVATLNVARIDHSTVRTAVAAAGPSPDVRVGLATDMGVWPDAQHRPSTALELGRSFAVLLGWGGSTIVEPSEQPVEGEGGVDGPTWLTITPSSGIQLRALAVPTSSGWAFVQIGLEGVARSAETTSETTLVSAPPPANSAQVRWWAMTPEGEVSGSAAPGAPIVVHAGIETVGSALLVFVDDQGRTISARGSANDPRTAAETSNACAGSVQRGLIDGAAESADALPPVEDANTDAARTAQVLQAGTDELRRRYPGFVRAEIGPGFGRAWTGQNGGTVAIVAVEDFAIVVHLDSESACPAGAALHTSFEGVPLFFVVDE
jgi:hypothetical protein